MHVENEKKQWAGAESCKFQMIHYIVTFCRIDLIFMDHKKLRNMELNMLTKRFKRAFRAMYITYMLLDLVLKEKSRRNMLVSLTLLSKKAWPTSTYARQPIHL
jgi:hypothetical protein